MGWMRTDYTFDMPIIQLTLGMRVIEDFAIPMFDKVAMSLEKDRPQVLAALVQSLVETHTNIHDSIVVGLQYDFDYGRWIVLLAHASFPRTSPSGKLPVGTFARDGDGWAIAFEKVSG